MTQHSVTEKSFIVDVKPERGAVELSAHYNVLCLKHEHTHSYDQRIWFRKPWSNSEIVPIKVLNKLQCYKSSKQ